MIDSTILKLSEYFTSIQGEGPYSGKYCLFVRFSKCSLNCVFCDTKEKRDKVNFEFSLKDLENLIVTEKHRHVVFTGGEPLLYASELITIKKQVTDKLHISLIEVETNGLHEIPKELYDFHFNISPKVWSSDSYSSIPRPPKCVYKFPIEKKNVDDTLLFIKRHNIPAELVYLMPMCTSYARYIDASELVLKLVTENKFNFSPRLHIIHYMQ